MSSKFARLHAPSLSGAPPGAAAAAVVCDAFVSLRGDLAYSALAQSRAMARIAPLRRIRGSDRHSGETRECPRSQVVAWGAGRSRAVR
eukprot:8237320-Pyramimonas_sp.AAC.1